jgi:hypothetical protein
LIQRGGLSVGGHVNGNNKLYFTLLYNTSSNGIENVTSVVKPPNFPPKKEQCKDNFFNEETPIAVSTNPFPS